MVSTHTTPPEIVPWPVMVDGKDGSLVASHKKEGGWFAYGSREPFFAIYKPAPAAGWRITRIRERCRAKAVGVGRPTGCLGQTRVD